MACIKTTTSICRQQNHCVHGCTINNRSVKRSLGSAASGFFLLFSFLEVSNSISWITDPDWTGLPVERTPHTLMTNVKPCPDGKALVADLYWRSLAGTLTLWHGHWQSNSQGLRFFRSVGQFHQRCFFPSEWLVSSQLLWRDMVGLSVDFGWRVSIEIADGLGPVGSTGFWLGCVWRSNVSWGIYWLMMIVLFLMTLSLSLSLPLSLLPLPPLSLRNEVHSSMHPFSLSLSPPHPLPFLSPRRQLICYM